MSDGNTVTVTAEGPSDWQVTLDVGAPLVIGTGRTAAWAIFDALALIDRVVEQLHTQLEHAHVRATCVDTPGGRA